MTLITLIDTAVRLVVGLGLGVFAYVCYVVFVKARAWVSSRPNGSAEPTIEDDRHTVLSIHSRLKKNGNVKAADTAYKLIGEMDVPAPPPAAV